MDIDKTPADIYTSNSLVGSCLLQGREEHDLKTHNCYKSGVKVQTQSHRRVNVELKEKYGCAAAFLE